MLCSFQHSTLIYRKVGQVTEQLVIIFRNTITSVVLEVVGQTIIKEHRALQKKRESQKHIVCQMQTHK